MEKSGRDIGPGNAKKIKIRMNLPCLLGKGNNYYTIRTIFSEKYRPLPP